MKWEVISREYLTSHPPYFISRKDVCKRPDGTVIPAYYVVELPPSVVVFALDEDNRVLMVKQYRHPVEDISLELPGGFVDSGEQPIDAAKREMAEETGFIFSQYEYLGKVAANPGVLNNYTHIFFAKGITGQQKQQLDHAEEIAVAWYTIDDICTMLKENRIIQALHTNACFYALLHINKLKFS